jgi:hypothetical protein
MGMQPSQENTTPKRWSWQAVSSKKIGTTALIPLHLDADNVIVPLETGA